jgi:hypothetical protein
MSIGRENLENILQKIKEKGELLLSINECCANSEGTTRTAYCTVIENELFTMMRLVDDYKMMICDLLANVSENAILRGSVFPNTTILNRY